MGRGRGRGFRKQNPPPEEDEYRGWGDYFSAKKAKLGQQLNTTVPSSDSPQIFTGISVYINGYTNPPQPELRSIFTNHGGEYTQYLSARTTFVVATNLPLAKKKLMWHKTLKPEWITDSVKAGVKLDHRAYSLYNTTEENKQATLTQVMKSANTRLEPSGEARRCSDSALRFQRKSSSWSSPRTPNNEADDELSTSNYSDSDVIGAETECSEYVIEHDSTPERDEPWKTKPINITPTRNIIRLDDSSRSTMDSPDPSPIKISVANSGNSTLRTTADDGFLDDFYKNSRLHLISTMKKETQYLVADWRKNISTHKFTLLSEYESSLGGLNGNGNIAELEQAAIFHIDLDCFFVAVGRLSRPHLIDMPIAVCHSKGTGNRDSKSDVACASYEARKVGVSAGMWLDEAKRLCPNIQVIPYDFEEYKRVSKIFFQTVTSLSLEIEAISCDELYFNATKVLQRCNGSTSASLASFIRKAIKESSKVDASIGIGNSKLSARIATRIAKENGEGQHEMSEAELKGYIRNLPVGKLPGVGWFTVDKLKELYQIQTCEQLEKITLRELNTSFGSKNGEKLYWLCRGVDKDPVNCEHVLPKSLSAGCSFGVRFSNQQDANKFTRDLANELSNRAAQAKCFGNKLTLNLWIIPKELLHDPVKPGGHGAASVHSRTRSFLIQTRDPGVIYTAASELARSITQGCIGPEQIRGVRISFDNLRYESEMSSSEKKTVQNTIASSFAAMKGKRSKASLSKPAAESFSRISPIKPKGTNSSPTKSGSIGILNYFKPKMSESEFQSNISKVELNNEPPNKEEGQWIEQNPCSLNEIDPSVWDALPSEIQAELKQVNQLKVNRSLDSGSIEASALELDRNPLKPKHSTSTTITTGDTGSEKPCCSKSLVKLNEVNASYSATVVPSKLSADLNRAKTRENESNATEDPEQESDTNETVVSDDELEILENMKDSDSEIVKVSSKILPKVEAGKTLNSHASISASPVADASSRIPSPESLILKHVKVKVNRYLDGNISNNEPCTTSHPNPNTRSASGKTSLNGVSTVQEIKEIIRSGIKDRSPSAADAKVVESYLVELLNCNYLADTCELIRFLWDSVPSLKKEGGINNQAWINVFLQVISQTEKMLRRKFGGVYLLPPH